MEIIPSKLIRISRYYMAAALVYLIATLAIGLLRVVVPISNPMVHWAPAILGWVSFPIMGAYYQFFPTLQGRELRFEGLTLPQFGLANLGLIAMTAAAWTGNEIALAAGTLVYVLAALIFAVVIAGNTNLAQLTLTLRFYVASLTYFVVAMALLFVQTTGLSSYVIGRPFLLHVLTFGWATLAIMGAQYSMVPMLQLKEMRHPRLADAQFIMINVGFWGLAYSLAIYDLLLAALAGLFAFAGIGIFVYIVFATLSRGPSRLPRLDISVKYFVVGLAYLIAASLTGIVVAAFRLPQLAPIHLHLGLIGFVTITIVGAMYHIVPFVVWWEVYAPKLGIEEVPLLRQLYSSRSATWQLYGLNAGLLLMVAGFAGGLRPVLLSGGGVLLITALAFVREMLQVLGHRRKLRSVDGTANNTLGGIL